MKKLSLLVAAVSFLAISCSTPSTESTPVQDSTVVDTTCEVKADTVVAVQADTMVQDSTK